MCRLQVHTQYFGKRWLNKNHSTSKEKSWQPQKEDPRNKFRSVLWDSTSKWSPSDQADGPALSSGTLWPKGPRQITLTYMVWMSEPLYYVAVEHSSIIPISLRTSLKLMQTSPSKKAGKCLSFFNWPIPCFWRCFRLDHTPCIWAACIERAFVWPRAVKTWPSQLL